MNKQHLRTSEAAMPLGQCPMRAEHPVPSDPRYRYKVQQPLRHPSRWCLVVAAGGGMVAAAVVKWAAERSINARAGHLSQLLTFWLARGNALSMSGQPGSVAAASGVALLL